MPPATTLAVDVGGTFTDAVLVTADGEIHTGKTPTTPDDQSLGVIAAAELALAAGGVSPREVDSFIHGMTVTTNALLEGRFAKTLLLATHGFEDIEQLGRQNRPSLYRLCEDRAAAIVPPDLRFGVRERCGPDGMLEPLDEASLRETLAACAGLGVESVAVCLLFSFRYPEHELRVGELVAELLPEAHVSLSHAVVGTFREYERCATTVADAALAPLLAGYLTRLTERASATGLPAPDVMLSNGGSAPAALAARNAASTVLSGPAGGAVGMARAARRGGATRALGFDMGGTSTDISVVHDGEVRVTAAREIAGRPVALPASDIFTVGAGGGSIAWCDEGGALRVGPRSAGARPGPACYGHGGELPTVTDANLLLGRLGERSALAGGLRLDRAAAERAIDTLAGRLGIDTTEAAAGIVRIANLEMLRATGSATIARGIDPRDHTLVAFGGAGPMHAAAIAEELGVTTVVCPAACGVLSAYGMAVAGRRRDRSQSVVRRVDELEHDELSRLAETLRTAAAADLGLPEAALDSLVCELRYAGQAFELPVETESSATAGDLTAAFRAEHERRYGFADEHAPVELVTLRVSVAVGGQAGDPFADRPSSTTGEPETRSASRLRTVWFDGAWHDATVVSEGPPPGTPLDGPAIIEQAQATIVVPPGWRATATAAGDVSLNRTGGDVAPGEVS
ncbi:MAG: hydantoinase/oxoprolinase family protein [Actinobacteria bacterium]|nr:hydantoinase/oxoprolinase family protein [Actinomycetota bacterium]